MHLFYIADRRQVADADALAGEQLEADEVLEAGGDALPPLADVQLPEVGAVDGDTPGRRLVEAAQELDERRLPCAVFAYERDRGAGGEMQIDVAQDIRVRAGVPEADVLEADAVTQSPRNRRRRRPDRIQIGDEAVEPAQAPDCARAALELL